MKRKAKRGRYDVYTHPDLYEADRPLATRLLKAAIVLSMVGILFALRRPLIEALITVIPWSHR